VNVAAFQVSAGNRSSEQDDGDNAQGDRRRGDVRGCLKSPDSVKFGDYTRSFQLPNTWAESYARTVSVEISGLFKHPLREMPYWRKAEADGLLNS
jgi:hypothetical protein